MKAYEVAYPNGSTFAETKSDVVFGVNEEDAKRNLKEGLSLFPDYDADYKRATYKHIPYLDDCEDLTLMKKVEKLITEGAWCWTFGGDALAFYSPLTDKEIKVFEKMWIETYGDEEHS